MDIFILKLNSEGDFVWAKRIGAEGRDIGKSIDVDEDGNIYSSGDFSNTVDFDPNAGVYNLSSIGTKNCFISKLDSNGNFLWAKSIETTGNSVANDIKFDPIGYVLITGHYEGLADFDPTAGVFNQTNESGADLFVLKLDTEGEFVWVHAPHGDGINKGTSLIVDDVGDVYFTGRFFESVDFDSGIEEFIISSAGEEDIFISKIDYNGHFLWAKGIGGPFDDYGFSIDLDLDKNIFVTGGFSNIVDFDLDGGGAILNSHGRFDIYVLKLNQLTLGVEKESISMLPNSIVFLNPANQKFTIQTDVALTNYKISLYDVGGKLIDFTVKQVSNGLEIELIGSQNGSILIQIIADQGTFIEKVLVQ